MGLLSHVFEFLTSDEGQDALQSFFSSFKRRESGYGGSGGGSRNYVPAPTSANPGQMKEAVQSMQDESEPKECKSVGELVQRAQERLKNPAELQAFGDRLLQKIAGAQPKFNANTEESLVYSTQTMAWRTRHEKEATVKGVNPTAATAAPPFLMDPTGKLFWAVGDASSPNYIMLTEWTLAPGATLKNALKEFVENEVEVQKTLLKEDSSALLETYLN